MSVFIIAEAGVNHNGSEELAMKLIEFAAEAGADAVKFQTFSAALLVSRGAKKAKYQEASSTGADQFEMLSHLELSHEVHRKLIRKCEECSIEFMSTGFDDGAVDFLYELGVKRFKIPSGEITNIPLLRHTAGKELPIVLSTGMATLKEVSVAVEAILPALGNSDLLTLLHCTSSYPTLIKDVNLMAMLTIKNEFNMAIGYSDHTTSVLVPALAVVMGATIVEKHFTLDNDLPGPDHQASLSPMQLTEMISNIRTAEKSMGSSQKEPTADELLTRDVARRSIALEKDIERGQIVKESDIQLLRPGTGIPPSSMDEVIGMVAISNLRKGEILNWSDLEA